MRRARGAISKEACLLGILPKPQSELALYVTAEIQSMVWLDVLF